MYDVSVLAVGALAMVDDHSGGDSMCGGGDDGDCSGGDNSLEDPGGGNGDRGGSVEDAGIGGSVEDKDNDSN